MSFLKDPFKFDLREIRPNLIEKLKRQIFVKIENKIVDLLKYTCSTTELIGID